MPADLPHLRAARRVTELNARGLDALYVSGAAWRRAQAAHPLLAWFHYLAAWWWDWRASRLQAAAKRVQRDHMLAKWVQEREHHRRARRDAYRAAEAARDQDGSDG